MEEVDNLFTGMPARWFAYNVTFGRIKISNGSTSAMVIVNAYITKFDVIQRKFEAPTLAECVEHLKKFLVDPNYVQAVTPVKTKQTNLFL